MIKFRQKDFSILSNTVAGAGAGASIGSGISFFRKDKKNTAAIIGASTLIGAALGAIVGTVKHVSQNVNRKTTVNARLMNDVIAYLKKSNLKEGKDFTRDPRTANLLKTKVCIVISKNSGELQLLINTINDSRLKTVVNEVVKRIPNTTSKFEEQSDRYNDITISTISDSSADAGLIAGISEKFIREGYPVYLVEVG